MAIAVPPSFEFMRSYDIVREMSLWIPILPPTQGKLDGEQVKSLGLDGLMLTLEAGYGQNLIE